MTSDQLMMPPGTARLLGVLRQHNGRQNAISMLDLYEQWSGDRLDRDDQGKPIKNVATLSRGMRACIDDLRDLWGIPVMSSSGSGYWIVASEKELAEVRHEFLSRGLKSLQTAARLAQNTLIDEVEQLSLQLQNESSDIHHVVKRKSLAQSSTQSDLIISREARMAAITTHLSQIFGSPEAYADEINRLQQLFGPKLLTASVRQALQGQCANLSKHVSALSEGSAALEQWVNEL